MPDKKRKNKSTGRSSKKAKQPSRPWGKTLSESLPLRVIELFAGVGGFRVGLERANGKESDSKYRFVWSNQYEPSTNVQHASDIYIKRWPHAPHSNEDIAKVDVSTIPQYDLLVGGFPCQDYSVARTLNQAAGLHGKKGVLWWQIHRIISETHKKPKYLLLENVDRLLKSPAQQRGRDFAVMLASLSDLGYAVEWRVINAADYGFPQRRRRVFIVGYHRTAPIYHKVVQEPASDLAFKTGIFAKAFPVHFERQLIHNEIDLKGDLADISIEFNRHGGSSPFDNTGVMVDRKVYSFSTIPDFHGNRTLLKDILQPEDQVPPQFYVNGDLKKWKFLKGAKTLKRISSSNGHEYEYSEGAMAFPDPLDRPARTIVTGEGGSSPSRFKHIITPREGVYRRLTPLELERLNMFPDDHTKSDNISDTKRAFLMGNAIVTGVVQTIGETLIRELEE